MKWSKYNYIYFSNKFNKHLLYNSLSNSFIDISNPDLLEYLNELKNKENIDELPDNPELFEDLKKSKIFVESDETEFLKIKHSVLYNRYSSNTVVLTVLPTLSCNFKCPYCFVEQKSVFMKKDIYKRIKLLLKNVAINNKMTFLHLTWMGGEPLLNFEGIKELTKMLVKPNIKLTANVVTNGYLLTKEVVEQLPQLNITRLQVTIDGLETEHNQTRIHKTDNNSFQKIINNLDFFFEKYNKPDDISINIRVNLARNSNYVKKFLEVYSFLRQRYKNENFYISPGFIEDIKMNGKNISCEFDKAALKDFYTTMVAAGLTNFSMYPRNYPYECAVRSPNCFVIGPSGELYSCWENIGHKTNIIGHLDEKGIPIIDNETALLRYFTGADYLSDNECQECFAFPICTGGCPEKRIRNKYDNAQFNVCSLYKENIDDMLDLHYSTKITCS